MDFVTARLKLRAVSDEDREVLVALGADERVMRTLGGVMSRAASEAWLEKEMISGRHRKCSTSMILAGNRRLAMS